MPSAHRVMCDAFGAPRDVRHRRRTVCCSPRRPTTMLPSLLLPLSRPLRRCAAAWRVLVDNRPGASGNLGVDSVAKSAPDGHTLVLGQTSNLAINPALYPELPY